MGRTLKRVPLDFDWPLEKVWTGYVNPHRRPCPEAGRSCFGGTTHGQPHDARCVHVRATVPTGGDRNR